MAKRWAEEADDAARAKRSDQSSVAGRTPCARLSRPHRQEPRRNNGAFLLANGRGAQVDPASPLAREPYLVVAELTGAAAQGRILLAAPIPLAEIETGFADRIVSRDEIAVDANLVLARPQEPPAWRDRTCRTGRRGRAVGGNGAAARESNHNGGLAETALDQIADAMARPGDVPAPCRG